ncbi:MAG: VPDSG-CTERM sorting domain-containing protein [Opitutaceae bacterium]|nr:VPDSG-CTERM sorting domain-containing protein [Opitutaceae bacterium]
MILNAAKLVSVFGFSLALASSASAITFNFTSGNSGLTSSKTYTVDGLTVTVTAHSWTGSGWDSNAKVGQYSGYGLGVTNSGNDGSHTVDSNGWIDYLKFSFAPVPADVNSVSIGYESRNSDSDFRFWLNNTGALSSTGGTAVNGNGPGTYNIALGSSTEWNYLIIAADRDNTGNEFNQFKISGLSVTTTPRVPNNTVPDAGSTLVLFALGLAGLVGLRKRLF